MNPDIINTFLNLQLQLNDISGFFNGKPSIMDLITNTIKRKFVSFSNVNKPLSLSVKHFTTFYNNFHKQINFISAVQIVCDTKVRNLF